MLTFTVAPGFVTTYGGLITLRAILGLVEGPLSPGIFLLLSSFYTRKELSFRYVPGLLFRRRPSLHWLSRIALFLTSATVRCEVLSQMFSVSSSLSWLVLFPGYSLQQSRTWTALVENQDGPGSLFLYFLKSFFFFLPFSTTPIGRIVHGSHRHYWFLLFAFHNTRFPIFNWKPERVSL